jgi:uncharacterized protein YndB with AHSA1/START domain
MSETGATMIAEKTMLNEGEGFKLQMSRVIKAKRERVFAAWTKPELILKWFGGDGRTATDVVVDLRVGGAYRFEVTGPSAMPADKGATVVLAMSGVYREIVSNELLCFTWNGTWNPGEETLVTVSLKDVAGGTELTLSQERFATEQSRDGHRQGWISGLDKLVRVYDAQA